VHQKVRLILVDNRKTVGYEKNWEYLLYGFQDEAIWRNDYHAPWEGVGVKQQTFKLAPVRR